MRSKTPQSHGTPSHICAFIKDDFKQKRDYIHMILTNKLTNDIQNWVRVDKRHKRFIFSNIFSLFKEKKSMCRFVKDK